MMLVFLILIVIILSKPIFEKKKPYVNISRNLLGQDEEIRFEDFDQTIKMFVEISDYVKKFEIDRTKIDVYINHYLVTYDEAGIETKTLTRFEV